MLWRRLQILGCLSLLLSVMLGRLWWVMVRGTPTYTLVGHGVVAMSLRRCGRLCPHVCFTWIKCYYVIMGGVIQGVDCGRPLVSMTPAMSALALGRHGFSQVY